MSSSHEERGRISRVLSLALTAVIAGACAPPVGHPSGSSAATVNLATEPEHSGIFVTFGQSSLQLPAGVVVAILFDNRDSDSTHNVAIYPVAGGDSVFRGETFNGVQTKTYLLGPLPVGSYRFICNIHPLTMSGTLTVGPPPL